MSVLLQQNPHLGIFQEHQNCESRNLQFDFRWVLCLLVIYCIAGKFRGGKTSLVSTAHEINFYMRTHIQKSHVQSSPNWIYPSFGQYLLSPSPPAKIANIIMVLQYEIVVRDAQLPCKCLFSDWYCLGWKSWHSCIAMSNQLHYSQ